MDYLAILFVCGLILYGIYGWIHSSHDNWSGKGNLDKNAKVADIKTTRYNKYKFKTAVSFTDGFQYTSFYTNSFVSGFNRTTIQVTPEMKVKIVAKAVGKHTELVEKRERERGQESVKAVENNSVPMKDKAGESSSIQSETLRIYNHMAEETRDNIYYGGYPSANEILQRLYGTLSDVSENGRLALANQIYVQVWIRVQGGLFPDASTPAYIREAVCKRFSDYPSQAICACVDECLTIIYEHEPQLKQEAEIKSALKNIVQQSSSENREIQDRFLQDPEYGLRLEKPVFVDGFGMDREYLSHLRTTKGERLTYQRLGSTEVNGISGPVDIYDLMGPDQSIYMQIFISVYGTRNVAIAPRGLKYVD